MPKATISARKHRINPDWENRKEEREQRIAERDKRRDEMFEKLVTAATTVMEELRMKQESSRVFDANYFPTSVRTLSKAAQDIADQMGQGYILRIRPGKAELVRGIPKFRKDVNLEAAYGLIDTRGLRHLEVERRGDLLGLVELGLYAKGNFYCCLQ